MVSRMSESDPGSDPVYKRIYAFREMVADLLCSVLPADALGAVDMHSLEKVPASYVGDDFRQRHGDTVWRLRAAGTDGGWAYALVLLEFQSGSDATMALRVLEYTAMLYRELLRAKAVAIGQLPPVLPVVLYNGESPWRAACDMGELIVPTGPALVAYQPSQRYAVVDARHATVEYAGELTRAVALLERSRSPADLARVAEHLAGILGEPDQRELRRAFADWLWVLCTRLRSADGSPQATPPKLTLEDVRMTLEERVAHWPDEWIHQGIEQGREQGIEQGREQGIEQGRKQGIEQGRKQGLQRGVAEGRRQGQRELLRRLAEARFGPRTAERLFAALRREDDPLRLDAIALAVVRCETGDELLRQAHASDR